MKEDRLTILKKYSTDDLQQFLQARTSSVIRSDMQKYILQLDTVARLMQAKGIRILFSMSSGTIRRSFIVPPPLSGSAPTPQAGRPWTELRQAGPDAGAAGRRNRRGTGSK